MLGYVRTDDYFDQEFNNLNLKDKRLNRRAIFIGNELLRSPGSCIQEVVDNKNRARAAYDFFSNSKVSWKSLFKCHIERTIKRVKESSSDDILVIQDSTFYNYSKHKAKIDIGEIGKQWDQVQFGFIQHTALCMTQLEGPLGIIGIEFFGYKESFDTTDCPTDYQPLEAGLASERWSIFLLQTQNRLKESGKRIITICDREADFFEFLYTCTTRAAFFVVRCKYNRYTGLKARRREEKLFSLLDKAPVLGYFKTTITDIATHQETEVRLQLKAIKDIMIPPMHKGKGHKQNSLEPILINVVQASIDGKEWILLTNLPVETLEEVIFIFKAYKQRWQIESFHKVLKTAYKAEQIYLHSSRSAILNLLALINIAACRVYWIMCKAREIGDKPASICFNDIEIKALHIYFYPSLPLSEDIPTLKTIFYQIAKLGGHRNTKNAYPPGILTIYRGMVKLNSITHMLKAISIRQAKLKAN
jgi:hypothetical protein